MGSQENQQQLEDRVKALAEHLSTIRRNTEKLIAENQRLREVVRLAESELRKRRDQVQHLESDLNTTQDQRQDAKTRVENAIEKLDQIMSHHEQEQT